MFIVVDTLSLVRYNSLTSHGMPLKLKEGNISDKHKHNLSWREADQLTIYKEINAAVFSWRFIKSYN